MAIAVGSPGHKDQGGRLGPRVSNNVADVAELMPPILEQVRVSRKATRPDAKTCREAQQLRVSSAGSVFRKIVRPSTHPVSSAVGQGS
jgi:hypothetical protein